MDDGTQDLTGDAREQQLTPVIAEGTVFIVPGYPLPRRGRPPLGKRAMSKTELSRRYREKKRLEASALADLAHAQTITPLSRHMRILALSDIHNNVDSVRQLRAQEANRFDVIIVAGDLGRDGEAGIFRILKTFKCPIVYVYGNWDRYHHTRVRYGPRCKLVHLNIVKVGPLIFTGFSFPRWNNCNAEYMDACRKKLMRLLRKRRIDLSSTVFISHSRTTRLVECFPSMLLHLFGHVHTFDVRRQGKTTLVNVSAVDRYGRFGNYAVIDIDQEKNIAIDCRLLRMPC